MDPVKIWLKDRFDSKTPLPYSKKTKIFLREKSRKREPIDLESCEEVVLSSPQADQPPLRLRSGPEYVEHIFWTWPCVGPWRPQTESVPFLTPVMQKNQK